MQRVSLYFGTFAVKTFGIWRDAQKQNMEMNPEMRSKIETTLPDPMIARGIWVSTIPGDSA